MTLKYLVICGSAATTDLSISKENKSFALVMRKPEASVSTVAQALSSQT